MSEREDGGWGGPVTELHLEILAQKEDREWNLKSRMKGKSLEQIKDEVRRVNPFALEEEPDPQIATVLIAAAFFVGPHIDRLATFTGYPRSFIADISCRMHDSGLWAEGKVFFEHWFGDDLKWTEFGLIPDCLVAEGLQVAWRPAEYESWKYQLSGRMWLLNAT